MKLTATQQDALVELINIGFGRAGAALSKLTGHRVSLQAPDVHIFAIEDVGKELEGSIEGEIATVHQLFTGAVAGDALLIIDHRSAGILKELLTDEPALPLMVDASAREVVTEVGNILLNACLGTFGNLLKVQVSFSVPRLDLNTLDGVLQSLIVDHQELQYALVVRAAFSLRDSDVHGFMVIVLGIASLDRLIRAVEDWA
jgi:chemotaxis protein CheC